MIPNIRISHPSTLPIDHWSGDGESQFSAGELHSFHTIPYESSQLISCVATFEQPVSFNALRVGFHPEFAELFPNTFRFEISPDGVIWEPILYESDFRSSRVTEGLWHFPLITARQIKFLFYADRLDPNGKYAAAFGSFETQISGVVSLQASSELDRLWVKENLIDGRPEYGWSSALRTKRQEEWIELDFGSINRVTELRLRSKDDPEPFFPSIFRIAYSEDNISWHHLIEENGFLAESATWYRWRFTPMNMRYLRLTIEEGSRTREGKYLSQLIEMELFAGPDLVERSARSNLAEPVPYASSLRSGIVRLATDGEAREGVVVQGGDRRLKDASTDARGIVQLARDGEEREGVVVQGSDRRLRFANEDLPGIVRLARDEEARAGYVVQSNDSRLRFATVESHGTARLAADGEDRSGVVVQGSDSRLKPASSRTAGVVRLAESGSDLPGEVVQGNDKRLRAASTELPGIMRFARLGEAVAKAAVQGSDPRLSKASSENAGIVELARDGESRDGVAVQGSDSRLKPAAEGVNGLVSLCPPGASFVGAAVQGSDPRLSDRREALPHEHDYASKSHAYSDHTGTIRLEGEQGAVYCGAARPPFNHAPIVGINHGGGSGLAGIGETEGVVGAGKSGVVGISTADGAGVVGLGRTGQGGLFLSERSYAVVAGGDSEERDIRGSGLALIARGLSRFEEPIFLKKGLSSIATLFDVADGEQLLPGDLVIAGNEPGSVRKSSEDMSRSIVGVVVERSGIVLNADEKDIGSRTAVGRVLVAFTGVAEVAVEGAVANGGLLVSSLHSGKARALLTDEVVTGGVVVARALQSCDKSGGLVVSLVISA